MYNSSNYFGTTGSLLFYSKDGATDFNANVVGNNEQAINLSSIRLNYWEILNLTEQMKSQKNITIALPLKFLNIFWRSLKISLNNCKVELKFIWMNCKW